MSLIIFFAYRLCSDIQSNGFRLIVVALGHADHEFLRDALGEKSEGELSYSSVRVENLESALQKVVELIQSKNVTLFISCVGSSWWPHTEVQSEVEKLKLSCSVYEPHGIFVGLQRTVLPHLLRSSPAALFVVSDTCVSSLEPSKAALAKYLEVRTSLCLFTR